LKTFKELGIKKSILDGLQEISFDKAFPIQEAAIPVLLSGSDVIGQAHTGTGKTAAFALSILQDVIPENGIQGLILAPTRELAIQITNEMRKFAKYTGIKTATIYGGQGMGIQLDALEKGVEIVVATPGRLIDHLKRGSMELDNVRYVVLDEADTMLDMGFLDDIQFILELTPEKKVMSVFSATMPPEILRLSKKYLKNPKEILLDDDELSVEGIDQSFLTIRDREKSQYLMGFIKENKTGQTIVFCSTKDRTRLVARILRQRNFNVVAIEGDMSQHKREISMSSFKKGRADILVATDVAARGIDVPKVALIINFDVPRQDLIYFHRIGRTARAGGTGRAITLVSYSSIGLFRQIQKITNVEMTDLNKKMGIKINVPDPLKIDEGPYGGGYNSHRENTSFNRNSRSGNRFGRQNRFSRENQTRRRRFNGKGQRSFRRG